MSAHPPDRPHPGPLTDVRVLDLTDELGAYCTRLLAGLGADVIKVEPPGGAPGRTRGPWRHASPGTSLWWLQFNTNKRSVALDLDSRYGQATLRRLVAGATVLVEDGMPGAMAARGLGYGDLRTHNPGLIYTSITPFGQHGPYAQYRASDLVGQAIGGLMFRIGWPEDPPNSMGGGQAYNQAGAHGAVGTLIALCHQDVTGEGQHVDVSMQEAVAIVNFDAAPRWALQHEVLRRAGPGGGSTTGPVGRRIWQCREGQVRFQLGGPRAYAEWPHLVDWLGAYGMAGDLGDDGWLDPFTRMKDQAHLEEVVGRFFMTRTAWELQEEGQARHILITAFNTVKDLFLDRQLVEEGFFVKPDHLELDSSLTYPGAPYRLSRTPWALHKPAPAVVGQHNQEVLGALDATAEVVLQQGLSKDVVDGPRRRLPLEGIRVLDFTWVIAGPMVTKWLAAYGAQVIKIEPGRGRQDDIRQDGGASRRGMTGANASGTFANVNTDKLAITLNMDEPGARAIVRRLVAVSDVVLDNFAPRVMPKWGFTYEELREINPQIITGSMPGFGSTGPHAHYRGYGTYFMARTGLDSMAGYPQRGIVEMGFPFPDAGCNPAHMAVALLAALHERRGSKQGQHIEVRQFESTVNYLGTAILDYSANGHVQTRTGSRSEAAAPHGIYPCAGEDRWCAISVSTETEWEAFCRVTGHPEWRTDVRFGNLGLRKRHEDELDALVARWTGPLEAEGVMRVLQAAGVAAGPVQHAGDLMERDRQLAARGFYVELKHPEIGPMLHEGVPFQLSGTPGGPRRPAPLLGEHNDFVLQEVLGMSEAEVNQCILGGVLM